MELLHNAAAAVRDVPLPLLLLFSAFSIIGASLCIYLALFIVAPTPRPPLPSEKTFTHIENGKLSGIKQLPCWLDAWAAQKKAEQKGGDPAQSGIFAEAPEVFMSLVIPAYNEEARLGIMLREAVVYLERMYPFFPPTESKSRSGKANGASTTPSSTSGIEPAGWEIVLVSDGSTDGTIETALSYARTLTPASASAIRIVSLAENRGKGGAVTHGMRHARGAYAIFADADGATLFSDLGKCVTACQAIEDSRGRGVAVGSRAHLVGSEAVVKRSFLRNFLMHSFHLLLRLMTPPATGRIRDTQCGFKLFSRASLPFIIPYMHSEGWIFDVEMLMLAESANIPVTEVPVGWKEVVGSKLNVVWDSLGMALGLAILRGAWGMGVYKRW
ncbi:MAG: dolichyl-phosphate beta-glucosyltransferase [Stictis urceolatum]|nr:dolichyl-phosphate beta-glucosyltransferase [Stictis urceolata]